MEIGKRSMKSWRIHQARQNTSDFYYNHHHHRQHQRAWPDRWSSRSTEILHCCTHAFAVKDAAVQMLTERSYWILLPITVVMILTGVLRHYLSTLLQSTPKRQPLPKLREQRSLLRAQNLRNNYAQISKAAFERRKEAFIEGVKDGKFLAEPELRGQAKQMSISDPAMMEGMMGSMKGQVAMMVPQSLIMGWINAFFSGYVISEYLSECARLDH